MMVDVKALIEQIHQKSHMGINKCTNRLNWLRPYAHAGPVIFQRKVK